jgi:type VI secretion system ImpJ/VasE family protein
MFLLPQHFQRQEAHFQQQLGLSANVSGPFEYGFRNIQIDPAGFDDWQFTLERTSGLTKGGTLFSFASGEVPRLDLRSCDDGEVKKRLESNQPVTVFLAFSIAKPNSANVSTDTDNSRFFEFEESVFDLYSGGNDRSIVFKKLKAVLTCSDQRSLDFEYMPIAQLELTESQGGQIPRVSSTFLPPTSVSLATEQSKQHFRKMEDRLSGYLRLLIDYLDAAGFGVSGISNQELSEPVYRYFVLSQLRGWLVTHNQSPGCHPFQVFQHLCQVIGQLAIVDPDRERFVNYPRYDHDDIYQAISWSWQRIERNFVPPADTDIKRIGLIAESMQTESGSDVIMKAAVPPEMFQSEWQLYLAFNYDWMTKEDSKLFFGEYLDDASEFYWKIGSHEKIDRYFVQREEGVTFSNAERSKPNLPKRKGWVYFDIKRNGYWDAVQQSGTICLRIDQQNLQTPKTDLGTERVTVSINQKTFQYQVSLFAVKKQSS